MYEDLNKLGASDDARWRSFGHSLEFFGVPREAPSFGARKKMGGLSERGQSANKDRASYDLCRTAPNAITVSDSSSWILRSCAGALDDTTR